MERATRPIDDYTLASFIAGTLPHRRRREVAAFLVAHPNARELLSMSYEALDASRQHSPPPEWKPLAVHELPGPMDTAPPQPPPPVPKRRPLLRRMTRWIGGALLVLSLGLGLRVATGPAAALLARDGGLRLTLPETRDALHFRWTAVPEALRYRLVVYDPGAAEVALRHYTAALHLNEASADALRPHLHPGLPYMAHVDALDGEGQILHRSRLRAFTLAD